MQKLARVALLLAITGWCGSSIERSAVADASTPEGLSRAVEFRFTSTARAQIALWIEKPDGTFMGTVRLTQAVSLHGIGNRPGASQMNSGFRWPYGRRSDVLPIWAHRRAAAPGALQFKPVIFQHRTSEGCASNAGCGGSDSSLESYFCLSFTASTTRQEALDAVSCASVFSSDKGRYLTAIDVAKGYAEPLEVAGIGMMRPLAAVSLYPPRRDGIGCAKQAGCIDHPDAATYIDHARDVMPDIDAVTMATPPADQEQAILFTIPTQWVDQDYVAWAEVNVEGDHNPVFSATTYRTPELPIGKWDSWAIAFGYPYRGQPSVVYRVPFSLATSATYSTAAPEGYSGIEGYMDSTKLHPMDGSITNDPSSAATMGSGADRFRLVPPRDYRLQVNVRDVAFCQSHRPPAIPENVTVTRDEDHKHSHQWGTLQFTVPQSERPIAHYEARYSRNAINTISKQDSATFDRALPALAAKTDTEALMIPVNAAAGDEIQVRFGGMEPLTEYSVAVRAVDACNVAGPYEVATVTTSEIHFTKLSGCFIATAAYGSDMGHEVDLLRRVRDILRPRSTLFAAATDLYYRSGPAAAAVVARSDAARALVRTVLAPIVGAPRRTSQPAHR